MSFSFGTSTPNVGAQKSAFGAPANPAPAFGASANPAPAFGATTNIAPAFGATATPTSAFGSNVGTSFGTAFGAPTVASTPLGGSLATTTAAPAFGLPTFGVPATTVAGTALPAFGAQTGGAISGGLPTFGAQSLQTSAGTGTLSFGTGSGLAPATANSAIPSLGSVFASQGTSAAPAIGLGGTSLSFGKPTAAVSASAPASLQFGTTTTSAAATSFNTGIGSIGGGGIFGKPLTTNTYSTLGATTAPPPFMGLGGIDVTATQPKPGDSREDNIKVKETQVPDEIVKTVDSLKNFIKAQKTISSDIGRTSTSKFSNVATEIIKLQWTLQEIANEVGANYNHCKLLRNETSKAIQSVEMAQRTHDTPPGLQFENISPFQYFQNLIAKYEQEMINFRQQIILTERHMRSLANPQNITSEDLKRGFHQISESFTSLAGRLHEIHQKVEEQKDAYLKARKYCLHDSTNVFESIDNAANPKADPKGITSGPTPFSNATFMNTFSKSYMNAANTTNASMPSSK